VVTGCSGIKWTGGDPSAAAGTDLPWFVEVPQYVFSPFLLEGAWVAIKIAAGRKLKVSITNPLTIRTK
jgi:hypothetical protein